MTKQSEPRFAVVAPVFKVADIKESVRHDTERLGFRTGFEWPDFEQEPARHAIVAT